jgi:Protein of unknown function (DUF3370)
LIPFIPFPLAQVTPAPEVVQIQEVRSLPGQLDRVPVFNSNSPELVLKPGILLSTFPPLGKKVASAHLNYPLSGRFDIFAHHIAKAPSPEDLQTLYLGVILHNPGERTVTVDVLQAASYLSQPDAPFIDLPAYLENPAGKIFAGPGDRVMNDILRGIRQADFPAQIVIPPGESRMLLNLPIPVSTLTPPVNGRSVLARLRSSDKVYVASLAMFAPRNQDQSERSPTLTEWQSLLENADLASPRDRLPTPPDRTSERIIYGRVAGVAIGSQWQAQLTDTLADTLAIPQPGQAFSYPFSTVAGGTLGTNQIHSAPLVVRYPDTAYSAHGNYGIQYSLTLPLINPTADTQTVTIALQTPIKTNSIAGGLRFFTEPAKQIFFRGTVQIRYRDDLGLPRTRYVHLVQRRGEMGEPLVILSMPAGDRRLVEIDFLYPPDASPPQVITVQTNPLLSMKGDRISGLQ